MLIEIGNKKYNVKEARTEEEKEKGLQGITELPEDEGMLFFFDPPEDVSMWMKGTLIPLDIIFIMMMKRQYMQEREFLTLKLR